MENYENEIDESSSLNLVFFCNRFVRELDSFRRTGKQPQELPETCDRAIDALQNIENLRQKSGKPMQAQGLLSSPDEIVAFAATLQRRKSDISSSKDVTDFIGRLQKAITKLKTQRFLTSNDTYCDDVLLFFEALAEESFSNCRSKVFGETTEAERIWQHYAMNL